MVISFLPKTVLLPDAKQNEFTTCLRHFTINPRHYRLDSMLDIYIKNQSLHSPPTWCLSMLSSMKRDVQKINIPDPDEVLLFYKTLDKK
eukprot:UN27451